MVNKHRPPSAPPAEDAQAVDAAPSELDEAELARVAKEIMPLLSAEGKRSVRTRAEVGRLLLQVREGLEAEAWQRWLAAHLPFTTAAAERTIGLYELASTDPLGFVQLAPLGVAKVYMLLALEPAIVAQLVDGKHTIPSTGAAKTLLRMTLAELTEVIASLDSEAVADDGEELLVQTYRRQVRALIRTVDAMVDDHDAIAADELVDLHDALLESAARFADAFSIEDG